MPKLKIAHVKDQGVNLIIVPLSATFNNLPEEEKQRIVDALQANAVAGNLNGRVVPVWFDGKSMRFIAPLDWHRYFQQMKMKTVRAHLNRELDLGDIPNELDPHEPWPEPEVPLLTRVARMFGLGK